MGRLLLPALIVLLLAHPTSANESERLHGHWEGYFELSRVNHIALHVDFSANPKDGEFGKIYNPRWGETSWPITNLKLDRDQASDL